MRPIKFRAWDGVKMVYPEYLNLWKQTANWVQDSIPASSKVLMEFTGLLDKKGREIYEGDIILTNEGGWIAQVIYRRGKFFCVGLNGEGFSTECQWEKFDVIGNIYENPVLVMKRKA